MNVKKTKSSKKIVLKITMSMTATISLLLPQCYSFYKLMTFSQTLDPFVIFIDSLSYRPLIQWPNYSPYSFSWSNASAGLLIGPQSY